MRLLTGMCSGKSSLLCMSKTSVSMLLTMLVVTDGDEDEDDEGESELFAPDSVEKDEDTTDSELPHLRELFSFMR